MFRKTLVVRALAVAFGAVALTVAVGPVAYAQTNAVGSVFGQVAAGAGNQVRVESAAIGVKRTIAIEAGRFQITALPPGRYTATLVKDGNAVSTVDLEVLAGQGAEAVFPGSQASAQLSTVQVVGRAPSIDVSNSANGSVFTARQLDAIPVATKDLNGIIALAANTTKADTRYAGGISIGGGAPSENSFYINGFPVTNALTQLGSIELPFGAIAQATVQTGGFGAEYGRSVGGVVSVTTKSGTNEFHGGGSISLEPNRLRSTPKSSFYDSGANPATDGTVYRYRDGNTRSEYQYGAYLGGPIVQDKLLFFVAIDQTKLNTGSINAAPQESSVGSTGWLDSKNTNSRYLGKLDWNLTDNHRLEGTFFGDNYKTTDKYFAYDYATHSPGAYTYTEFSKNLGNTTPAVGGEGQTIRYTGILTDDLTLSALYGQSSSKHSQRYSFSASSPQIFAASATDKNPTLTYNAANPLPGGTTGIPEGAQDKTKSFRLDAELKLGSHTVRVGLDENRLKSQNAGESYQSVGGVYDRYFGTTNGAFKGRGGTQTLIQAGAIPVNGRYYYVRERIFDDVTGAQSDQSAQYIEDRYQITDKILLTYGLRNESFKNKNGDGDVFLESKNFVSPRLAASWDVLGDSSLKVFGSAGRYSLQIPTHVAVRGASRSLFTDQYFAYTGTDPLTGAPTGKTALGPATSANNEYGQAKDYRTVSALDLKPTYQDELTLGIEKALTPSFNVGAKATYRKLKATIDDFCDQRPFDKYATDNGIDASKWGGFACASFNPGKANSFLVDYAGTGQYTTVNLSSSDLGFESAKRNYFALDLFIEHPFSNGWYGKLNYTYSKSKGNTEGQTKSDNAQTDVAATSTWDFHELMEGSYGYLPNDRTHQIKTYGYYQVTPEWGFGGAFLAESGRPKNCFGNYGGTGEDIGYGNVFFYCANTVGPNAVSAPTPRGSQGRLPWNYTLDFNVIYKPAAVKGLALRIDVFNAFNRQSAQVVDETREPLFDNTSVLSTYGRVISYSAPRKLRLTAQYDF